MSDTLRNTILRFAIIIIALGIGFLAVIGQIIHLQVGEKERWEKIAATQKRLVTKIEPNRGNILDADGRLLASSLPQYYVKMDTRVEALHLGGDTLLMHYVDSIAEGLSRIVGDESAQTYRNRILTAARSNHGKGKEIRVVKKRINYTQMKQIKALPLIKRGYYKSGFSFDEQHKRIKPFGSLASRSLGSIYAEGGYGNSGLEKQFESYLHGEEGRAMYQKVAGHWEYVPVQEAENGSDIITTLDANLLDITEAALRERLEGTQADWGCCILMEVKTGEIKAICNLDSDPDGKYYEKMNHAVTRVEPGSTFKTISLMAMLDDGKIDIDDTIRVSRQPWVYINSKHTDSHPKDTIYTVRSALAVSSNIAFAKMVTQGYEGKAEKFVNKLEKMGVTQGFAFEIPGANNPRIEIPKDKVTLSKMAYGYSVELSPLQILTFYNGIANGGKMIRPILVKRIEKDGDIIEEFKTETLKQSLCSSSTLKDVQSALHDVVWDDNLGTASVLKWGGKVIRKKAQSERVHIAGKTGTAQLIQNGHYQSGKHRMTFVGYFPEEAPEYTCICMINHPHNYGAYDAGMDCGKVVRVIAEKVMSYTGVKEWKKDNLVWVKK